MKWSVCSGSLLVSVALVAAPAAAHFELVEVGPRALGLGNNFVSVADDATALYWNPAGLARLTRHELVLSGEYTPDIEGVHRGFAGVVLHAPLASVGIGWNALWVVDALREDLVYLSCSRHLVRRSLGAFITAGATLKLARVGIETGGLDIPELQDSQIKFTSDLGVLASPIPNVRFGLAVRNLGRPEFDLMDGGTTTPLRSETEWGVSLRWRTDAQLHFSRLTGPGRQSESKIGVEVDMLGSLMVRLGASDRRLAAGLGFAWSRWRLDTSFQEQAELGTSTRLGLFLGFGPKRSDLGDDFDEF